MKKVLYSIYDRATMNYSDPFYALGKEDAVRAIRGAFGASSQLVLYPADYVICELGSFDSASGVLDVKSIVEVEEIKNLIPVGLRQYCLDGTFGGVDNET